MITIFLLSVGKVLLLTYFLTRFEPLQEVIGDLGDYIFNNKSKNWFIQFRNLSLLSFFSVLSCSKCLSFWLGTFTYDFWIGSTATLLMAIFEKSIGGWLDRVDLK